jgi:hypothetical protein
MQEFLQHCRRGWGTEEAGEAEGAKEAEGAGEAEGEKMRDESFEVGVHSDF